MCNRPRRCFANSARRLVISGTRPGGGGGAVAAGLDPVHALLPYFKLSQRVHCSLPPSVINTSRNLGLRELSQQSCLAKYPPQLFRRVSIYFSAPRKPEIQYPNTQYAGQRCKRQIEWPIACPSLPHYVNLDQRRRMRARVTILIPLHEDSAAATRRAISSSLR